MATTCIIKERIFKTGSNYTLDEFNQFVADLKELDLDDLLDEYYIRRTTYQSYFRRDCCVHWSEEREQRAMNLMKAVRDEICDRIENPV
jgi:hypothetical protein